jgi:hypothetical protein
MCRQQWQADQHKKIIAKMYVKMPGKSNDGKRKNNERNHHNSNGRVNNNSEHLKTVEFLNCGKKGNYSTDCSAPRKHDNENSNMVSKADFKNLFQSSLKDMLTKKEKQKKNKDNMEVDDESLDMNVFEKLMEGKHT